MPPSCICSREVSPEINLYPSSTTMTSPIKDLSIRCMMRFTLPAGLQRLTPTCFHMLLSCYHPVLHRSVCSSMSSIGEINLESCLRICRKEYDATPPELLNTVVPFALVAACGESCT